VSAAHRRPILRALRDRFSSFLPNALSSSFADFGAFG
jgi:hypothetical protein